MKKLKEQAKILMLVGDIKAYVAKLKQIRTLEKLQLED